MENIYFFIYSYLPGISSGGPVISISRIIDNIPNKSYVITLNRDVGTKKKYKKNSFLKNSKKINYIYKSPGIDSFISFLKVILKMENNSVIYMSSFFRISHTLLPIIIIKVFRILGFKKKVKLVISPRNEFALESLKFGYWKKMVYIFLFKNFLNKKIFYHSTTQDESKEIISILGIKSNFIYTVQNIDPVQIPLENLLDIKKNVKEIRLFYVGRISKDKNVHLINQILFGMEERKKIIVDLWGPIRDEKYFNSIMEFSDKYGLKVNYKGTFLQKEKYQIYQSYHALLLPALAENYGHAIADSLSFSVPVIISNKTPWKTSKNFQESGIIAIDNRKLDEYRKVISYLHSLNKNEFDILRKNTFNQYKEILIKSSKKSIFKKIFENN